MDEFALLILLPPIRQDFRLTDDISTKTAFFKGSLGQRVQFQPCQCQRRGNMGFKTQNDEKQCPPKTEKVYKDVNPLTSR